METEALKFSISPLAEARKWGCRYHFGGLKLPLLFGKYINQRNISAMTDFHKLPTALTHFRALRFTGDMTIQQNFHLCSSFVPGLSFL